MKLRFIFASEDPAAKTVWKVGDVIDVKDDALARALIKDGRAEPVTPMKGEA